MNDAGEAAPGATLSYCAAEVRRHHPDRYLATLFAPAEVREDLLALYAFDREIGKVRTIVSQPIAGLVRLQWWRDALAAIEGDQPPAHPVVLALHSLAGSRRLPRPWMERAIAAREREIEDEPPTDLAALERHLAVTAGGLVQSTLGLLGIEDATMLALGQRVGLACGLTDLLSGVVCDARAGRLWLPQDLMAAEAIAPDQPMAPNLLASLCPIVARIAAAAREHLRVARGDRRAVPKQALPALFPGTLAGRRLQRLARHGHDPASLLRPVEPGLAPLRLLWHRWSGSY